MSLRRTIRRRRRPILAVLAVAVVVLVLALSLGGSKQHSPTAAPARPAPSSTTPSPFVATPFTGGSSGSASPKAPSTIVPLFAGFPGANDIVAAGDPARKVTMTVSSDAAIIRLGYLVRGGHPSSYSTTMAASPASITTTAYGYGLVAEVGAQASPYATYITCSVSVDGKVATTRTVKGPWVVTVCFG